MQVALIPVAKEELKPLITIAFDGDSDLLNTYHILAPATLDECVNHTFSFIDNNKDFYGSDMKFYKVVVTEGEEKEIGFTVTIKNEELPNELYSFGISREYRTWDITKQWLDLVDQQIGVPYYMILWSRNTRAINFFERNGFISEERNDLKKLILKT